MPTTSPNKPNIFPQDEPSINVLGTIQSFYAEILKVARGTEQAARYDRLPGKLLLFKSCCRSGDVTVLKWIEGTTR